MKKKRKPAKLTGVYKVRYLIDCVGTQISKNDEQRVIESFTSHFPLDRPIPWIKKVRHANNEEESLGYDIIFETTDAGDIHVQIKGSELGLTQFAGRQHRGEVESDIICVVINPAMEHRVIFTRILTPVSQERKVRLKKVRRQMEQELFPNEVISA